MSKFIKNTLIYTAILLGYIFLYVLDVEQLMNPDKDVVPSSKVEFVYSQF